MKVIFSGYYGVRNSGDDAFIEVAAWGCNKFWKADEQIFIAKELPKIISPAKYIYAHRDYLNFARTIRDIFSSDAFVSAGGSTFQSSLTLKDLRTYSKLKKKLGIKGQSGAIGISLGPFKNMAAEKSTREYLKTLNFLALRDNTSYEMACSYDLPYKPVNAFDLAALLPNIYGHEQKQQHQKSVIGISVCNYESYTNGDINKEKKRNDFICALINSLKKNPTIKFRFFIFNGNSKVGDEALTQQIIRAVNTSREFDFEIIPYQPEVKEMFKKISECDVLVSTRLHAGIFACFSHVPFFLLEYHRKCTDFLDDIGQCDRYRLNNADAEVTFVAQEIENILFNKVSIAPSNLEISIDKALLNFTETYLIS